MKNRRLEFIAPFALIVLTVSTASAQSVPATCQNSVSAGMLTGYEGYVEHSDVYFKVDKLTVNWSASYSASDVFYRTHPDKPQGYGPYWMTPGIDQLWEWYSSIPFPDKVRVRCTAEELPGGGILWVHDVVGTYGLTRRIGEDCEDEDVLLQTIEDLGWALEEDLDEVTEKLEAVGGPKLRSTGYESDSSRRWAPLLATTRLGAQVSANACGGGGSGGSSGSCTTAQVCIEIYDPSTGDWAEYWCGTATVCWA